MEEQEIFKGQTLIINLNTIEMIDTEYTFVAGDKVRIAIKKFPECDKNVLYDEVETTAGEKSCSKTFTATETLKLEIGEKYILQADLLTKTDQVFPMLLQTFRVVGRAIIPEE